MELTDINMFEHKISDTISELEMQISNIDKVIKCSRLEHGKEKIYKDLKFVIEGRLKYLYNLKTGVRKARKSVVNNIRQEYTANGVLIRR